LYKDFFDHKDWGFYYIPQVLYNLDSIRGLYLFSLISILFFATGCFFIYERILDSYLAFKLSILATFTLIHLPTFLPCYSEDLAIAFAVLGLGLHLKNYKFFSGIIFAISAAVKISNLGVYLFLVLTPNLFNTIKKRKNSLKIFFDGLNEIKSSLLGFLISFSIVIFIAAINDEFFGWLEIFKFNLDYSKIHRVNEINYYLAPLKLIINFFKNPIFFQVGENQAIFKGCLIFLFSLIFLPLVLIKVLRVIRETQNNKEYQEIIFSLSLLCFVTLTILLIQGKPDWHHFQYFFASVVIIFFALFNNFFSRFWILFKTYFYISFIFLLFINFYPTSNLFLNNKFLKSFFLADLDISRINHLNDPNSNFFDLRRLRPNSSFAIFGGVHHPLDIRGLDKSVTLKCRFFYIMPHFFENYYDEISSCLAKKPDYIFFDITSDFFNNKNSFYSNASNYLENSYSVCNFNSPYYKLFVREKSLCDFY